MRDAYILAGARTPFAVWSRGKTGAGGRGGALAASDPFDLGAAALRGALSRAGASPQDVSRLRFGNMYQEGPHGCYGGRYAALRAGLPARVPALTLHMSCGSGLHVVAEAARDVGTGEADLVAAAAGDSPSRVPKEIFLPSFTDLACSGPISLAAERTVRASGITREDADRWTELSHARARKARDDGRLAEEIVAVGEVRGDDAILPEGSGAVRAARPVRGGGGIMTPTNTHAVVDGGAALLLSSRKTGALGRVLAWEYAGVEPAEMAAASVPAVRGVLKKIGASVGEIDLFDINETFAAQVLLDARELGIGEDKLNVRGGALALGHPFAATGLRQVLGLLLELRSRGLRRGVAAVCVGGGQGVAVAVESL